MVLGGGDFKIAGNWAEIGRRQAIIGLKYNSQS